MTPADMTRNLLLLRASETLSATVTTANVVEAVRQLEESGLEASHLQVVLADGGSDPLTQLTVRERRTFYFTDSAELAAAFPGEVTVGLQAAACVPLVGSTSILGALHLRWDAPRTFYVAERAVIATLAAYVAQALERAQRLHARNGVADILHAILSRLPAVERYEVAAHYLPADRQEKVGGDWYDAVSGRDGQLTMVIGDVVGHDIAAAARMGQLRSMLRAYIVDRHEPPSALLRRLDAANHTLGEPTIATAVVAVIDALATGGYRLRWSNAGHPPPIVIHPDGAVQALEGNDSCWARAASPGGTRGRRRWRLARQCCCTPTGCPGTRAVPPATTPTTCTGGCGRPGAPACRTCSKTRSPTPASTAPTTSPCWRCECPPSFARSRLEPRVMLIVPARCDGLSIMRRASCSRTRSPAASVRAWPRASWPSASSRPGRQSWPRRWRPTATPCWPRTGGCATRACWSSAGTGAHGWRRRCRSRLDAAQALVAEARRHGLGQGDLIRLIERLT
jgi:hypothetical protein